jgi:hypothetical protein
MLDYNVARSMCLSPIMSALRSNGVSISEASFLSGIDKERLVQIGMGIGEEVNIEEAARLASLVGMELSIVPESAGIHAFTEIAVYQTSKADMLGYARRVVDMTDKVSDLCIDLRLATELPNGVFERTYGVDEGFMAHLADVTKSASTNLQEIFKYLTAFGATLVSFPKKSEYVNYYRAVIAVEGDQCAPATKSLKVA